MEMDPEVAGGMAEHALGFFGFYDRIIDNALEPTDRNLFYMFQDYDLLTTTGVRQPEEITLRELLIHALAGWISPLKCSIGPKSSLG